MSESPEESGASRTRFQAWENGPPSDPSYFPIAVWLQDPSNAKRYQEVGINLYVGLWKGPTEEQLATLKAAGMRVICEPNAVGMAHQDDSTIVGWMHGDEPDNAQPVVDPKTGKRGYGPPVPPARIVDAYRKLREQDPSRPILLNLGQGVANDQWVGRGPEGKPEDYLTYVKGGDIISFDVYPVAGLNRPDSEDYLWYVAKGVDRLAKWTNNQKFLWNCIECTHIDNPQAKASPHQVRAEVWMSLVHGSTGLIYFVHQFQPKFNEHALLDDPEMFEAVKAINGQIHDLAPILNSRSFPDMLTVRTSESDVPIHAMVKQHEGLTYVFAVGMRNAPARATFTLRDLPEETARAEVLGENRTVTVRDGVFEDDFAAYDVHLYRLKTRD